MFPILNPDKPSMLLKNKFMHRGHRGVPIFTLTSGGSVRDNKLFGCASKAPMSSARSGLERSQECKAWQRPWPWAKRLPLAKSFKVSLLTPWPPGSPRSRKVAWNSSTPLSSAQRGKFCAHGSSLSSSDHLRRRLKLHWRFSQEKDVKEVSQFRDVQSTYINHPIWSFLGLSCKLCWARLSPKRQGQWPCSACSGWTVTMPGRPLLNVWDVILLSYCFDWQSGHIQ